MQNFRLRRAKNMFLFANLNQNQLNLSEIAPEGREKNLGRKNCHFTKTNKKTLMRA